MGQAESSHFPRYHIDILRRGITSQIREVYVRQLLAKWPMYYWDEKGNYVQHWKGGWRKLVITNYISSVDLTYDQSSACDSVANSYVVPRHGLHRHASPFTPTHGQTDLRLGQQKGGSQGYI